MATITFWLNAFIPQTVDGYTQVLSGGPHAGKTAVPLPGIARLWPGNTFKDLDAGYLTDQRTFNPAPDNSVRMRSIATVDLAAPGGPAMVGSGDHDSSGTTEVNMVTGKQTGYKKADMSRCRFFVLPRRVCGVFTSLDVQLEGKAGDPLVGMAADIDYEGTFTIMHGTVLGGVVIEFRGKLDQFPAYDCYATYKNVTKELFRSEPPLGNTVADLVGYAKRPVSGKAVFP